MITVIANLKGGSGKSTVAFNLAVWLEKNGHHVVGYDLDPQCTFSDLGMLRKEIGIKPELEIHPVRAVLKEQLLSHGDNEVIVDVGAANMAAMKEAMTTGETRFPIKAEVKGRVIKTHVFNQLDELFLRLRIQRFAGETLALGGGGH